MLTIPAGALAVAVLLSTVAHAQQPRPVQSINPFGKAMAERCAATADKARMKGKRPRGMKLGDQPPADQMYTLFRQDRRGCPDPIVLNKGIGGTPAR